jgi:hypothetical protein
VIRLYTCKAHNTDNCRLLICINSDLKPAIEQETRKLEIIEGIHATWMAPETGSDDREALSDTLLIVDDLAL